MTTGGKLLNATIPMPDSALLINSQFGGDKVHFTVSQTWTEDYAGLAIEGGMGTCIIKGNVTFGDSEDVQGECYDGFASVTVVVYMDEEFEPDECEACNVNDLSEMGGEYEFCAYRVELPCEPMIVDCGEPSAAPSGSYFPSSAPSDAPTDSSAPSASPTASPSAGPTGSPSSSPSAAPTEGPTSGPTTSPTASPSDVIEMVCAPPDPILISNDGETMYPAPPVVITSVNTTHVTFNVENTFGNTASSVFTEYHSGSFGETECLEEENVEQNAQIETEFVAQCMVHTKISIVNIWVTDCSAATPFLDQTDNAEIPECCHAGEQCRTVQYTFKLPCVSPCDDEASTLAPSSAPVPAPVSAPVNGGQFGRPDEYSTNSGGARRNLAEDKEGSTEKFESITTGQTESNNAEDDHFCVNEDYPCGPNNNKVHVCHYSALDGYKTFCVPESDSDVLRFYPKDYCGPCVGGYGSSS